MPATIPSLPSEQRRARDVEETRHAMLGTVAAAERAPLFSFQRKPGYSRRYRLSTIAGTRVRFLRDDCRFPSDGYRAAADAAHASIIRELYPAGEPPGIPVR